MPYTDAIGYWRLCEQRRREEMILPLTTDRVTNDMLRLESELRDAVEQIRDLEGEMPSGGLQHTLDQLERSITELED